MNEFLNIFIISLVQYSFVGIPLLFLSYFRRSSEPLKAFFLLFLAFAFDTIVVFLPHTTALSLGTWNWEGKALEFLWPLFVVYLLRWLTPSEVGLHLPRDRRGWLWAIVGALIFIVYGVFSMFLSHEPLPIEKFNAETLLYQCTMPGLAEEIVYRGIFLAICNKYLPRQWIVMKVPMGWGGIFVTVLFIMVHLVNFVPGQHAVVWSWKYLDLEFLLISFMFVFLREKSASIWPCVLCHNLLNGGSILAAWILWNLTFILEI